VNNNTSYDSNLVKARSRDLVMKASIEGSTHLQDGNIKLKLIRTYSKVADDISRNYDSGYLSLNDALQHIKNETDSLYYQSKAISQLKNTCNTYPKAMSKGITLVAGITQVIAGAPSAFMSYGICLPCDLMFLHGLNNIQEGGMYFLNGGKEIDGFFKKFYVYLASIVNFPETYGKVAYDIVDLSLSIKGIIDVSNKMKLSRYAVTNGRKEYFILFNAYKFDFLKGYQKMSRRALGLEVVGDIGTSLSLIDDLKSARDTNNKQQQFTSMNDVLQKILAQNQTVR